MSWNSSVWRGGVVCEPAVFPPHRNQPRFTQPRRPQHSLLHLDGSRSLQLSLEGPAVLVLMSNSLQTAPAAAMEEPATETITDVYGFQLQATVQQQAIRQMCDGSSTRAEAAWLPFVQQQVLPPDPKLKELIRKGVPPALRGWVWSETSGAAKLAAAASPHYYTSMALAGERSRWLKDIDQDITHTFPHHPWLHTPDGQAALRRVLAAYSMHNEAVGYCRCMNHIAALLLLALNRNEGSAFWMLVALVEHVLAPGTYSAQLQGAQLEMKALEELLAQKLPRLADHLAALGADVSLLATEWFLAVYAASLPSETVARVWDAVFKEGPKVLFRVALALLMAQEQALLACDNAGDLLMQVRSRAAACHDRDRLMEVAFDGVGGLSMVAIERFREQRSHEVEAAIRERQGSAGGGGRQQSADEQFASEGGGRARAQLVELGSKADVMRKGLGSLVSSAREKWGGSSGRAGGGPA